jgi:hypothetical protein
MITRLVPKLQLHQIPLMLGISLIGAIIAGGYGMIHDQITYSLSEEYFTKMKFIQFQKANFGLPVRVFVSEIGFLATWWVGLISGWFIARITVPVWPRKVVLRLCLKGFGIMIAVTFLAGVIGYGLSLFRKPGNTELDQVGEILGIVDTVHFVQVAYIHMAGYIGGLAGLVPAIYYILKFTGVRLTEGAGSANFT